MSQYLLTQYVYSLALTDKQLETDGWISNVVTDDLVVKHQTVTIYDGGKNIHLIGPVLYKNTALRLNNPNCTLRKMTQLFTG